MEQNLITHGISGDVLVVIARTGELLRFSGMTAFIVRQATRGLLQGKKKIS